MLLSGKVSQGHEFFLSCWHNDLLCMCCELLITAMALCPHWSLMNAGAVFFTFFGLPGRICSASKATWSLGFLRILWRWSRNALYTCKKCPVVLSLIFHVTFYFCFFFFKVMDTRLCSLMIVLA